MKRLFTVSILLLSFYNLLAQKQANNWALGNYQLDFNSGQAVVKFGYADYLNRGIGIISDQNGSLLFYSDGFSVWNKNHQLMPNGTELIPAHGNTSTQESIIIPDPGNSGKYYLFTIDPWNGQNTSGLYYSIVDLSAGNGLGDVTTKGIRILENTTNKISAAFHENGRDVWLLTHQHNTNNYYSFLVSSEGVSDAAVLNHAGKTHGFWSGQLKFSTDGKKVACSRNYDYSDKTSFDLFDFDPSTGRLSNGMSFVLPADRDCEGIDFSADSKKLYVAQGGSSGESGLYQFDLSSTSQEEIQESMTLLHREIHNGFRQLQLATDGNIYITKGGGGGGTAHLGVISNVNAVAADVIVEENGLDLQGGSSFVNFTPNFIQNYFFQTSFSYENTCQSTPTQFTITNTYLLESVEWSFGEGSASTAVNPEFTYEEAGTYSVVLTARYPDHNDVITKEVIINPFPDLELGEDVIQCYGSKISVDNVFSSYKWHNGDTTSVTTVTESGYYTLQVTNKYGCIAKDSLYVDVIELPQISLPDTVYLTEGESITLVPGDFDAYSWSTGETSPTIDVSQPGWYSVVVKNQSGCESSKSFYMGNGNESTVDPQKWIRLNPRPTQLIGNDIYFVNEETGFIVNDKELLTTKDQGSTWEKFMDIDRGNRIAFIDGYGYIIGANGSIYKSTYNGGGWNKVETGFYENLNSITLLHPDTLFITSDYKLFKSFNGGNSWEVLEIKGVNVEDSYFINHLVGHVACTGGTILKTTDGGESWYETETSNTFPSDFFRITFVNETLGFATQEHDDLYKTTDGGESWHEVSAPHDAGYALQFINENTGFIAGTHGAIHKTLDGGESWSWIGFDGRKWGNDLYAIHFINEQVGFATGLRGRIIRTYDGGNTWENYSLTYSNISELEVTSENTVYMLVGNEVLKSTDRGENWINQGMPGLDQKTANIDFINDDIGFAIVGGTPGSSANSGSVYKTTDGGTSWSKTHDAFELINENLYCIDFVNEQLGVVSGGYNQVGALRTTDGGKTWTPVGSVSFGQIQFLNENIGYARNVGDYYNSIYKTLDSGETWNVIFEIEQEINSFHFVNESVGYFVGADALMYKTIDGGDSWQKLEVPYDWYEEVKFYSENFGFIADEEGRVFKTLDGGLNWDRVNELSGIQNIDLFNEVIYASGINGNVLRSTITLSDQVEIEMPKVSAVRNTKATIKTEIRSSLASTKVYFEVGRTDSNFETFAIGEVSGNNSQELVMPLTELEEGTTYYCRFKIVQGDEVAYSKTTSFTTWTYDDLITIGDVQVTTIENESAVIEFFIDSYLESMELYADIGLASDDYTRRELIGKYSTDFSGKISFTIEELSKETEYFLRISVKDGEKNVSGNETSFFTTVLNVNESIRKIAIYPNPTTSIIKFDNVQNLVESYILDVSGKILQHNTSGQNFVDLSALPSGTYLLVLIHENSRTTVQVIKR